MEKHVREKLLELNEKWNNASSSEKDQIVAEVQQLTNGLATSEKVSAMESALQRFKEKLELAKESFSSDSLEIYNQQLSELQKELEDYKKDLFLILKS